MQGRTPNEERLTEERDRSQKARTSRHSSLLVSRTIPPRFGAAPKKQQDRSRNELRATDGDITRSHVWLPYLILRSWIIAADHFQADYIAAPMRPQHQLFYKRILNCELYSELRQPLHQLATVGLVTLNFATSAERLYKNLPFLRSTPSERQQLFEHDRTPSRATGQYPSVS